MKKIAIAGLANIETSLRVDKFPLEYYSDRYTFFGAKTAVSGVGYNLAKSLTVLGNDVSLLSIIGNDLLGEVVKGQLVQNRVSTERILPLMGETSQSVILYDEDGRRQIHVDLKNVQEMAYPEEPMIAALEACDLAVLGTVNFSRPYLPIARKMDKLVATDVQSISDIDDDYNRDYMAQADILFMSHERLPMSPEQWIAAIFDRYQAQIAVVGLGADGCLLVVRDDHFVERIPAVQTRPIVSTVGAGDSLFSSFLHTYLATGDPYEAAKRAVVFASWKIGAASGSEGFLTPDDWALLCDDVYLS